MSTTRNKFQIAIICGGPSLERGISLNSARSLMDHLSTDEVEIKPFYFDSKKNAFALSPSQLYSNTPADFDFKLGNTAFALNDEQLEKELKSVDIVFPAMHGNFGEDGQIQKWLEDRQIPFVGSSSSACKKAFDKYKANEFIKENGFFTLPSEVLKIYKTQDNKKIINDFFREHKISRAIVKPATGGSSIGVFSVDTPDQALEKTELIFSKRMDTRVVIEPFASGKEFTVIILQSKFGLPVAILPTEIEADYDEHQIFDYRKKYLPTRQVTYHCPPRFSDEVVERIQIQAEQLFTTLGMKDFARFDGWVLDDGNIWFSDFNPISGMEQNSFLFQQASRVGLSHRGVLSYIVSNSYKNHYGKSVSFLSSTESDGSQKETLPILLGGDSSERQVSLMSGTNVWLKLRKSKTLKPVPFLVENEETLWKVPYQLLLNHTVEEILDNCTQAEFINDRISTLVTRVREKLGFAPELYSPEFTNPQRIKFEELLTHNRIFIALHGGFGENGKLQKKLEDAHISFNGPTAKASALAMDKQATADAITNLNVKGITSINGGTYSLSELNDKVNSDPWELYKAITDQVGSKTVIAKPSADGCSSGVVHLADATDLKLYVKLLFQNADSIDPETFAGQPERIELPTSPPKQIRFEKYIKTDSLKIKAGALKHKTISSKVEITIGVIEIDEKMHALNPSITIAEGEVLSVEEKFQGGTGINITPPPIEIMSTRVRNKVKKRIEELVEKLEITGYCRIDAFVDCDNGDLEIIEINSLPALTPSTVLFQQGLAEEKPLSPLELLETIALNK